MDGLVPFSSHSISSREMDGWYVGFIIHLECTSNPILAFTSSHLCFAFLDYIMMNAILDKFMLTDLYECSIDFFSSKRY